MPTTCAIAPRLATIDPYGPARTEFDTMMKELEELGATSHVDLGKRIQAALDRIGVSAYQGHLDKLLELERAEVGLWGPRPPGSEVRVRARGLETEFGRVIVRRHGYRLAGEKSARFPLDEALNLPPELYGLSLRERVAKEASVASYDRTVEHVDDVTAGHVPKRQSEALAVRAAADFDAFYEQRVVADRAFARESDESKRSLSSAEAIDAAERSRA